MRKGFTLIELLVVIAMVCVGWSIMTAPFRADEAARRADHSSSRCLSNVKQLAVAMMTYAQDYDGMYPKADRTPFVRDYVKDERTFVCEARPFGYSFDTALDGTNAEKFESSWEIISIWEYDFAADQVPTRRHNGATSTVAFLDGHAKQLLAKDKFLRHDCFGADIVEPGTESLLKEVHGLVPLGTFATQ